jgi:beta-glucosidase
MYYKNTPLFPFGHGLTYTSFKYSGLKIDRKTLSDKEIVNVSFSIQNTGNYDSDEVPQLYISFPGSKVEMPAKALKGFARIFIRKGETKNLTIPLKGSDLTYWDTNTNKWTLEPGKIELFVGSSSADARLKGNILIK